MCSQKLTFLEQFQEAVKKAPPPLITYLKLPSLARELSFGAFLQTGQLHFLWVSSPPLCLLLNWQSLQSSDTLETTFSL